MTKKILIFAICLIISCFIVSGAVIPDDPHWFYGDINMEGSPAGVGTVVIASIGGAARGNITVVTSGLYGSIDGSKLSVTHYSTDSTNVITFSVTSPGCSDTNTFTDEFETGVIENLDFAFTGSCSTSGQGGTDDAGGSAASGGSSGGAVRTVTKTLVSDSSIVAHVKQSLPDTWKNVDVYQYGVPSSKVMSTTTASTDTALTYATETNAISEIQQIKSSIASGETIAVPTTSTLTVYHVRNNANGLWAYSTGITLTTVPSKNTEGLTIVEVIPSSLATLEQITFVGEQPEILQSSNGVIAKWTIGSAEKDTPITRTYYINKKLLSLNTLTLASGKVATTTEVPTTDPSTPEPPASEKATPWVGIILVIAIVILGLIAYFWYSKKN